ncbi:MAG: DUF1232 domain-containing protein [Muribaculaceae bacterium]|jgi:uncharacterized membrane protein YkvA (DUF1232 family)|nr:DUF1232 domain-containing protein [Muribaculaceae bacterium]MBR6948160.1 DUF1232 domain-containing protein [Muribaculaceae bacterium]
MPINKNINLDDYVQFFNDSKLWKKLKKVAQKAGRKAVYYVLVLYYVSRDPSVPRSLKLKVLGALGYFILPLDFIPDVIVALGFTDDLAALAWALFTMRKYITPEIQAKARERLREWFGPEEGDEADFDIPNIDPMDSRVIDVEAVEY